MTVAVSAAPAQDTQMRSLIDRIERLQRDMNTLQRQVYRGEAPPAPAEAAQGITSAPTAGSVPGAMPDAAAARIELRLSQFEAELRILTGQVEEATYRGSRLGERLDRLAADMEMRLQRLERGAPAMAGAQPGADGQPAPGAGSGSFDTGPKTLGGIPARDLEALQTQGVQQASPSASGSEPGAEQTASLAYPLAGETPDEQYQHAFGLLRQADYGEAELALRAFLARHPTDPLAGNAKYWLGETYYVRGDFQQAAVTFAEAYQEYPDSSKAADNLLKLGMSLSSLKNKADACGTFAELLKRYPEASATVIQRSKQERQRLACP